jgi:cbb3-type cytochrome oxidase subunit 3
MALIAGLMLVVIVYVATLFIILSPNAKCRP